MLTERGGIKEGPEISAVNFVGSICTAPFVGSQSVQEDGLIIGSPCSPAWSLAARPLSPS